MSSVVATVREIVTPILDEHHFQLIDLEYKKEGKSWYLRIFIDKPGGITLDDCTLVSEQLGEKLDTIKPDPIPQAYFLEVSSPGAERPLKNEADYQRALDQYIHLSLYAPVGGQKVYEGYLRKLDQNELELEYLDFGRHKQQTFSRKNIAQARLAIDF